jgi:hypothetical protein
MTGEYPERPESWNDRKAGLTGKPERPEKPNDEIVAAQLDDSE